jgi:cytochrome c oxidase assembly protein subunit 15
VALSRLAGASIAANVLIVVTGGAVRLTGSGLGCPTWPKCSGSALVPTNGLGIHKAIEFTNRMLTFVVAAVLVLTLLAAWRQHREVRLAAIALASIPVQAVLGGIVVLTDLNPWLVATHFLLSAVIIAVTALFWWRVTDHQVTPIPRGGLLLARVTVAAAAAVLVIGTLVTGSGPHAGDLKNGRVHRIHIHADAVMVLIGLSVGVLALGYALGLSDRIRRAAWLLLIVELSQAAIGYTQYFLHVPPLLVALHMFGACLVWLAALAVLFVVEPRASSQSAAALEPALQKPPAPQKPQKPQKASEQATDRVDR